MKVIALYGKKKDIERADIEKIEYEITENGGKRLLANENKREKFSVINYNAKLIGIYFNATDVKGLENVFNYTLERRFEILLIETTGGKAYKDFIQSKIEKEKIIWIEKPSVKIKNGKADITAYKSEIDYWLTKIVFEEINREVN